MSEAPDYPQIVPKTSSKARGIDFFGVDGYYYIARSDLGVYMRSKNFHEGSDITVFALSQACRWGDHYFAGSYPENFYMIKGNSYRKVKNLNEDSEAVVYDLHPNCRGGTSYYSCSMNEVNYFYIVFAEKGVYRRVTSLDSDEDAVEYSIHEAFQDGIYFWATADTVYCLKQASKWGVNYHCSTSLNTNEEANTYSIHQSVLNLLPGGLAQTKGKAFGEWQLVKSFQNESESPFKWVKTIKKTVGFNKREMSSIEHNWSIKLEAQYSSGALTEAIAKYQFNLTTEYGGKSVKTHGEEWSEATEKSETIEVQVQPKTGLYIWQYQMGFGKEKSLFCHNLIITHDPNTPQEPPLAVENA